MCGYWEPNTENHDFGKLVKDSSAQGWKTVHLRINYMGLVKEHFHSNQFSLNPNFFFKFSEQICLRGTLAKPQRSLSILVSTTSHPKIQHMTKLEVLVIPVWQQKINHVRLLKQFHFFLFLKKVWNMTCFLLECHSWTKFILITHVFIQQYPLKIMWLRF